MPHRAALLASAASLGAALLLGGCQTAFDAVGVAVPLSAQQSRAYDGSYQGTIRAVSAKGPTCFVEGGERVLMVGDGVLWYAYNPATLFTVPVKSDGAIEGVAGDMTLSGQVKGNHLEATVKSPACESRISMDYVLDHS